MGVPHKNTVYDRQTWMRSIQKIILAVLPKGIYCALKRKTNMKGLLNETLGIKNQNKESVVTST